MPTHTSHKRDHSSLRAKVVMRQTLLASLPRPLCILEAFGGTGELWKHCYDGPAITGLVIEQQPQKAQILAVQRPRWIVVEGSCVELLTAGLAAWMPFDLIDLDAHGSPLSALSGLLARPRALSSGLWIVATDGVGSAIRRGSIPSPLQPALVKYGRHRILREYPAILHEWLEGLAADHHRTVHDFRWRVAGSAGQLYHWMVRLDALDSLEI